MKVDKVIGAWYPLYVFICERVLVAASIAHSHCAMCVFSNRALESEREGAQKPFITIATTVCTFTAALNCCLWGNNATHCVLALVYILVGSDKFRQCLSSAIINERIRFRLT